jgi:PAS domain S-box-containing protein
MDEMLTKIAKLNEAQAANRIDEATWKKIFDAAADGMIVVDRKGTIMAVNDRIIHMFGYPSEELVGKPVHILLAPEFIERHKQHIPLWFKNPTARPMESGRTLQGRNCDGEIVNVQISIAPTVYYGGVLGVATLRPVTGG